MFYHYKLFISFFIYNLCIREDVVVKLSPNSADPRYSLDDFISFDSITSNFYLWNKNYF